jgi:hypothetical protein
MISLIVLTVLGIIGLHHVIHLLQAVLELVFVSLVKHRIWKQVRSPPSDTHKKSKKKKKKKRLIKCGALLLADSKTV